MSDEETVLSNNKDALYKLQEHDRVTANITIVHEHFGDEPFPATCAFAELLTSLEQPYHRRLVIKPNDWVELDVGYVEHVGMVLIENRSGLGLYTIPTPEEKEKLDAADLLVCFTEIVDEGDVVVRPRRFTVWEPTRRAWLRAKNEPVPIRLWVFPQ